jgi:hypothetical protein
MKMVEKIAKAIEAACRDAAQDEDEYCSPGMAKAAALAVLKAMREPTDAMVATVAGKSFADGLAAKMHRASFTAMIDAAIVEAS